MTIPPIQNNPLIQKATSGEPKAPERKDKDATVSSSNPQDVVQISDAARKALESEPEAKKAANDTRNLLEKTDIALGLPPDFKA